VREEIQSEIEAVEKAIGEALALRDEVTIRLAHLRRELDRLRAHLGSLTPPASRTITVSRDHKTGLGV